MAKKTKENGKKRKGKYSIWQKIFYTLLLLFFIGTIAGCIFGTIFFFYIANTAPPFDPDKMYRSEPSTLYDKNGDLIMTIGTENRVILSYDEIPEVLINAIIATEDSKFFQHNGFDLPRFLVASAKQLLGKNGGGASTLTMQLSKNNYTSKTSEGFEGIRRKFWDIYISIFKIEPSYSKQQILEFYANSNQLGVGYGVEAASKAYFGKSAKDLNVSEAALIAGMYQAPTAYNPYVYPENAEERRQEVLYLMHRHRYISDKEYEIAMKMTVDKIVQEKQNANIGSGIINENYQSFVDMVIQDVTEKTGQSPYTTSMKIYTTLDPSAQKHVSDIMNGKTYKWQNNSVQAGVAVVDVNSGAITAIGGGRNIKIANSLNRATSVYNQIGSTAKPLYDYGPAVEYLNWNTGTIVDDSKTTYSDGSPINNWDNGYIGFNTIETHLKMSRNIPALRTFQAVPKNDIIEFTTNLGLSPEIYSCNAGYKLYRRKYCKNTEDPNVIVDANKSNTLHEAHAIGGYEGETPLTMAIAYSAFANGGYYNEPYSFTKIVYTDTNETYVNKTETRQVMQDSTAYIITKMLQETANYGIDSGSYRNINGIKYAAKTGTTNFDSKTKKEFKLPSSAINEYWVVGYNTEYAVAVWYGYDKIQDGYLKIGSSQHQRLFQAVAKGVMKSKADFKKPDSVVEVTIEKDSAVPLLPSQFTPSNYKTKALFVSGTEPNKVSTRFQKLGDVSNLNATDNGDGTVNITWSPAATPDALNIDFLTKLNSGSTSLSGASVTRYANSVLKKNQSALGNLGYNVYAQQGNGSLELLGWTANNSFKLSKPNGTYNIVVKTCYSKFKSNMSDGKSISITINGSPIVDPNTTDETNDNNGDNNTDTQDNSTE